MPTSPVHNLPGKYSYRTLIYTNEQRRAVLAVCLAAGASGVVALWSR